jgi:transcriptional regulator with XRE-family HTH domain
VQNRRHPPAANLESRRAVAARLRQAVHAAGGNRAVAERSGVPLGSVNNYVGARTGMKMSTLTRLAAACRVSLEWLASGDKSALTHELPTETPLATAVAEFSEPPGSLVPPNLATGIDTAMLTKAIEIVAAIDGGAALRDQPSLVARRIAATYAVLTKPSAQRG